MLEYLGTLFGMHEVDGIISSAEAAEKRPKQVQTVPFIQTCSFKDIDKIRECLDRKFKDDNKPDPHADMWDPNWINKKD